MRVLVIIHEYPPVGGGGGRAAQDLCRELYRRGVKVDLFYPRSEPALCPIEGIFYQALRNQATTH